MINCRNCGTDNLDGSQYCDECGTALHQAQQPEPPRNVQPYEYVPPPPADFIGASVTSVGVPPVVEEKYEDNYEQTAPPVTFESDAPKSSGTHATLVIERGTAVGAEFELTAEESYLGRWDADNGVFPDVDLDAHDPEAKVSRRHARILRENGRYNIEDLGSTNGTFVNRGRRLLPGSRQPLEDGDEIIVGKTFLRFRVNN